MRIFRMLARSIRDAFKSVIRNFSLSLASISCITITLIIVAIAIMASFNVQNFTQEIEKDLTIVIFLNNDATEDDINRVEEKIRQIPNVDKSSIVFQSKQEVKEEMQDQSEVFTLRNALNAEYDKLYSTAKDVLEEKKARINKQIEEDAAKLATKSIIDADKEAREKARIDNEVKSRALEMVEEYKGDMSKQLYEATKQKINTANVQEALEDKPKRRIVRKNV